MPDRRPKLDRRYLWLAITLIAIFAVWVTRDFVQLFTGWGLPTRSGAAMQIVAHRGDTVNWPEDTAEAIWAAASMHPDGIEFDVHQSASGTWWVIHDSTLDRTTDGTGSVHKLTDPVIAAALVDAGLGFEGQPNIHLATLETVLSGLDFEGVVWLDLQHAVRADPAELARAISGRAATILCRGVADAEAIEKVDPSIFTVVRMGKSRSGDAVDGWLADAFVEATSGNMQDAPLPVSTYIAEGQLNDESLVLRRAWSVGVRAFLTRNLPAALRLRDQLAVDGGTTPTP